MLTTRRFCPTFTLQKNETEHIYTFPIEVECEHIQYCGFSFSNDQQLKSLPIVLSRITFSDNDFSELNGQTLLLQLGLLGLRTTYDESHNRTHVPLFTTRYVQFKFTVSLHIRQLDEKELKSQGVKENRDLFRDPELFVSTTTNPTLVSLANASLSKPQKFEFAIPFQTMDTIKTLTLPLPDFNEPHIVQFWFLYNVLQIRTTSSVFGVLQLVHSKTKEIVHTYTSPIQLQVLDKAMNGVFATDVTARKSQEKYLTITFGNIPSDELAEYELVFHLHEQFYKDYTNWVNEDKDKLANIKDAVVVVQYGVLSI